MLNDKHSCLVLIDLQVDYLPENGKILNEFPNLPNNVSNLLNNARSLSIPIIHIREIDSKETSLKK